LLLGPKKIKSNDQDMLHGDMPSQLCFRAIKNKGTFHAVVKVLAEIPMEDSNDTSSIDFLLSSVPVNVTQSQRGKQK
jgi:hypothetical protein